MKNLKINLMLLLTFGLVAINASDKNTLSSSLEEFNESKQATLRDILSFKTLDELNELKQEANPIKSGDKMRAFLVRNGIVTSPISAEKAKAMFGSFVTELNQAIQAIQAKQSMHFPLHGVDIYGADTHKLDVTGINNKINKLNSVYGHAMTDTDKEKALSFFTSVKSQLDSNCAMLKSQCELAYNKDDLKLLHELLRFAAIINVDIEMLDLTEDDFNVEEIQGLMNATYDHSMEILQRILRDLEEGEKLADVANDDEAEKRHHNQFDSLNGLGSSTSTPSQLSSDVLIRELEEKMNSVSKRIKELKAIEGPSQDEEAQIAQLNKTLEEYHSQMEKLQRK